MTKTLKYIGIFMGIFLLINSFIAISTVSTGIRNQIPGIIGIIILLYSIFYKQLSIFLAKGKLKIIHIIFKIGLFGFIFTFLIFSIFVSAKDFNSDINIKADAIIVLGAGLKDGEVSNSLAKRLDKAFEYYLNNEDVIIVVSGGQGEDEPHPESLAMKNYLIEKGVNENYIIEENKSSNTVENFQFSKEILDEHFENSNYTTTFTTNGYHVFRSEITAKAVGLESIGISGENVSYLIVTNYLSEYFSFLKFIIIDYFRL